MSNLPKIPDCPAPAKSKFSTLKLTPEEATQIVYGEHASAMEVENRITDVSRWSIHYTMVFEMGGKHYRVKYTRGATEYQEQQPFENETEVECVEVESHEVKVTQWLAVEAQ